MGMFSGMKGAQVYGKGAFLDPGEYKARITKCLTHNSNSGKGLLFIAEMEILETNHEKHPVGSKRSWVQKMTDTNVAFPALKEFCAACSGIDPQSDDEGLARLSEEIEGLMDAAVGEENVLAESVVYVTTYHKKTKSGGDFTVHVWKPCDEDEE